MAAPVCPGLPGHPPGPCPHPPEPGDRYCAGCRAEFEGMARALAYYQCPQHLVAEAWEYIEEGQDPAEVIEELVRLDRVAD